MYIHHKWCTGVIDRYVIYTHKMILFQRAAVWWWGAEDEKFNSSSISQNLILIFAWKSSFANHTNQNHSIWNWTDLLQEPVYKEWNGKCYTSWRMGRLNIVDWRLRVWPDQIDRPICCQLLVQCILISLFSFHRYYTGNCVTGRFNFQKKF